MVISSCRIMFNEPCTAQQIDVLYEANAINFTADELSCIDAQWQVALARNSENPGTIFNGNLFSLRDWGMYSGRFRLTIGDTNYKEYVGTRSNEFRQRYSSGCLANPLAVCAAIVTSDSHILIERRQGGDVYSNAFHVIGGFMDRDMDILNGVVRGPFYSITREIAEEVFLELTETDGILTGLVYDELTPHPELCFSFNSHKSLDEIIGDVAKHADREVGDIFGVRNDGPSLREFLLNNSSSISITGVGCLLLHGLLMFGNQWFVDTCSSIN